MTRSSTTDPLPAGTVPAGPTPGPEPGLRGPTVALAALATAQFLVTLEASIVNVALPQISAGLELGPAGTGWIVNSYLVTFAGLMLLGGRLADLLPRRTVFLAGLGVFTAASLLAGLAPSGAVLLVARVLQGAGAAVLAPAALSLLVRLFPSGPARARALGVWGAVSGAGGVAGVLAGGWLSQGLGWPAIFLVNLPVAALVYLGVTASVPPFPGGAGRLDVAGSVTATTVVAAACLSVVGGPAYGWTSPATVAPLAVALAAGLAFVAAERHAAEPLAPLGVLRHGPTVRANAMMAVLGAVMVGLFFFLPQYQHDVLGMTPATVGTSQVPIAVAITVGSAVASRLATLLGSADRALGLAALAVTGALLWLAAAGPDATYVAQLLGPFVLAGLGLGTAFVLVTTRAVAAARPEDAGLASGLVNTARQAGGALGLSALIAGSVGSGGFDTTTAFLGAAALAGVLLVLSLVSSHPSTTKEN